MSRNGPGYSLLIHQAVDFAAAAHKDHFRKEKRRAIPYFSHCAMVGRLLEKAGFDEEVVAAGILHDTLEDTEVTLEMLERAFGPRVAELVDFVTEQDKSLSWEERKARYHERLVRAPREALAISCMDKIHNIWSLILLHRSGGDVWQLLKRGREKQLSRFDQLAELLRERLGSPLYDDYDQTLKQLKEEC